MKLLRSRLRPLHQDEDGQIILAFALMFVVLLGFTAMVSDVGIAYWNRRVLQNAVDSAALAGANKLTTDSGAAIPAAVDFAQDNGVLPSELICEPSPPSPYPDSVTCQAGEDATFGLQVTTTYNQDDTITVSAQRHYDFGLRYIVGGEDTNIVATASAIIAAVNPSNGLWPFGVNNNEVDDCAKSVGCILKGGAKDQHSPGNFGYLKFPDQAGGTPGLRNSIEYQDQESGIPLPTGTDPDGHAIYDWEAVGPKTGNDVGAESAVDVVMEWDKHQDCHHTPQQSDTDYTGNCASRYQAPPADGYDYKSQRTDSDGTVCISSTECPRVGIVPLVDPASWPNGNSGNVKITGFACFYLQGITAGHGSGHDQITGKFLNYCTVSSGQAIYGADTPLGATGQVGVFLWR